MKRIAQPVIIVLGIAAAVYGIEKMAAETATMIIPAWMLISVVVVAVGTLSFALGYMIKSFLNTRWYSVTFTSVIVVITVVVYAIVDRRPTLQIILPAGYTGSVDLLVSRDTVEVSEVQVNRSGIGYITEKEYERGFDPKVIQGGKNISESAEDWGKGETRRVGPENYFVRILSFVVPGPANDPLEDMSKAIGTGAIDTARLQKVTMQ